MKLVIYTNTGDGNIWDIIEWEDETLLRTDSGGKEARGLVSEFVLQSLQDLADSKAQEAKVTRHHNERVSAREEWATHQQEREEHERESWG